jgi:nucleotide-binding universal stress UspA family protein
MTATAVLFALLCAWLLTGIACSFVMARRGHDPWSWGALGAVFGPLVVPIAIAATRREAGATAAGVRHVHVAAPGNGPVDVLVGIDGSPEAAAAARTATMLFGDRIGRLTLAYVLDYDAAGAARSGASVFEQEAAHALREAAAGLRVDAGTDVLAGRADTALVHHARERGFDVIVVGNRGRGMSKALLGSVAGRLASQSAVPVLVAGVPPDGRTVA